MLIRQHRLVAITGVFCLVMRISSTGFSRPLVARAEKNTITIQIAGITQPSGFLPALLTVHVHDVVFLNDANPAATYSVVGNDQSFASPPLAPGQQWSTTFTTPEVHDYTDPAYSSQLFGELIVVAASVQLLPTPQPGAVETALAQDTSPPILQRSPEG